VLATNRSQILQDQLCAFCFSRSRLSRNHDALILAISFHVRIGIVPDREDVRRKLPDFTLLVELDLIARVDGEDLVGIDGNQYGAGICLKVRKTRSVYIEADFIILP